VQWRKTLSLEAQAKLLEAIRLVAAAPERIDDALTSKVGLIRQQVSQSSDHTHTHRRPLLHVCGRPANQLWA
jgi:hypothetical protein